MERRLYCESPYTKEWQADVKDIIQKDGKFLVELDDTAFYPGGGGQPSDRGTIDGIAIEDVYEDNGKIYHILSEPPKNKNVKCLIDFVRRFDLMQQHTGQHLLSAILFNEYQWKTSSFHLGEDEVSIDVTAPDIPADLARAAEDMVNDHIYRDLEVKTHIVKPGETDQFRLRKMPPVAETISIVEICDIDFSPCCGTHVARTGEIGIIKILKTEKRGKETRVYFKCGKRALHNFQRDHDIVSRLSKMYRSEESDVISRAEAYAEQLGNTQKELSVAKEKLLGLEAKEMAASAGSPFIHRSYENKSFDDISKLMKSLLKEGDFIIILSSIPDRRLLFAKSGNIDINCGNILKEHLEEFNGKGGGGDKWANAGFKDMEDLKKFETFLGEMILKK